MIIKNLNKVLKWHLLIGTGPTQGQKLNWWVEAEDSGKALISPRLFFKKRARSLKLQKKTIHTTKQKKPTKLKVVIFSNMSTGWYKKKKKKDDEEKN